MEKEEPELTTDTIDSANPGSEQSSNEAPVPEETLVEEELLVEEISIDGMCGVY